MDDDPPESGAVMVSKCPRCSRTWELPEPHGGICTFCFVEVVDAFEEPAASPEEETPGTGPEAAAGEVEGGGGGEELPPPQHPLLQTRVTRRDIRVMNMVNGSLVCVVCVNDGVSCSEIKEMVAKGADIPSDSQRIFVGSRELLDSDVLGNATAYIEDLQVLRIDPRIETAEKLATSLDLDDLPFERRCCVLEQLAALGDGAALQADRIVSNLKVYNFNVLRSALAALRALGPHAAKPHLAQVEELITRGRERMRLPNIALDACQTLSKLGFATPRHAQVVADLLQGGPDRATGCRCLVALGPELAAPHLPLIAARLKHPSAPEDRTGGLDPAAVAMDCLAELGPEVLKPYVGDIVKYLLPHKVHCLHTLKVLDRFGYVSEVASALHSRFPDARLEACRLLTKRGSEAASLYAEDFAALTLWTEALPLRIAAMQALGSLGPFLPDEHLAALVVPFEDEDPNIRAAACAALVQQGAADEIAHYLQHHDPTVCRRACVALGDIGLGAVPHMGTLQKLCCDTRESYVPGIGMAKLRDAANDTIQQLELVQRRGSDTA